MNEVKLSGIVNNSKYMTVGKSDMPLFSFVIVVEEQYESKTGPKVSKQYINCKAWGKVAEDVAINNVSDGTAVELKGKLTSGSYESKKYHDDSGAPAKMATVDVNVNEIKVL